MKHSTLTNPADLHYAKVRTFTGEPSAVTADFIDQLLVRTDTKEQFIATGTTEGALIKLASESQQTQPLLVGLNQGSPVNSPPLFVGQTYFDFQQQIDWIAVHTRSQGGWIPKTFSTNFLFSLVDNTIGNIFTGQAIKIFFNDLFLKPVPASGIYAFSVAQYEIPYAYSGFEINNFVFSQGLGCYAFLPSNWGEVNTSLYSLALSINGIDEMESISKQLDFGGPTVNVDFGNITKTLTSGVIFIESFNHSYINGVRKKLSPHITIEINNI